MVKLHLQRQTFPEVHVSVNIPDQREIQLKSDFGFRVNYAKENKSCLAILRQELNSKDPAAKCQVIVEVRGLFQVEGIVSDEDKKEAHVQAYKMLFPYVQNEISRLMTDAGLPPLMVQPVDMKVENVQMETGNKPLVS